MTLDLKNLDGPETEAWIRGLGLPAYRGKQIRHWLFQRLAGSMEEMTNLPKSLRTRLASEVSLSPLQRIETRISRDGTHKMAFRLHDGPVIESVLIPERDHFTLCISSQAGCAMGCRFCCTARQGLKRNLSPSEILEQVIDVKRSLAAPETLTNIVFMGMGEPLANYAAVLRAARTLIQEDGLNFSHRKVTLSTCGIAPRIQDLGRDITLNLAVSLNAADDETRSFLMPVNQTYPLEELLTACREFPLPNRRMLTFEYILMAGVNDRDRDARELARILSPLHAKINLIAFNPFPEAPFLPPSPERVLRFQEILVERHYTAIIRKSKGQDISAACGQLSGEAGGMEAES